MQPKTDKETGMGSTFNVLADKWEKETGFYSLMGQMAQHFAYQQILAIGEDAIPLILRRIERQGGLWYHALETITGVPSPAGIAKLHTEGWHTVDVKMVNAAWLQWGKEQGYQW